MFHLHMWCKLPAYTTYEDGTDSVPKRRHIKFRPQKFKGIYLLERDCPYSSHGVGVKTFVICKQCVVHFDKI